MGRQALPLIALAAVGVATGGFGLAGAGALAGEGAAASGVLGTFGAEAGAFAGATFGNAAGIGGTIEALGTLGVPSAVGGAAAGGGGFNFLSSLKDVATVLSPVSSLVQAAGALSAKPGTISLTAPPPVTMPIGGGPISFTAQQNDITANLLRRGRASTVLTDTGGDKLGN